MKQFNLLLRLALAISLACVPALSYADGSTELAGRPLKDYVTSKGILRDRLARDILAVSAKLRSEDVSDEQLKAGIDLVVNELHPDDAESPELTVESLALASEVASLEAQPNGDAKIGRFLSSYAVAIVSRTAVAAGLVTASVVLTRKLGASDLAIGLMIGVFWRPFQAGPLGEIWKSLTSWALTPATEAIKRFNAQFTAALEQGINNGLDRWKKLEIEIIPSRDPNAGHKLQIATVEQDGMDFAGQDDDEQKRNYDKNRRMWVGVAKRYGQLNRDTHHHGRILMLLPWADETTATILAEVLDSKIENYDRDVEDMLRYYRMATPAASADLARVFDALRADWDQFWRYPEWNGEDMSEHTLSIDGYLHDLGKLGVEPRDLDRLEKIRVNRVNALGTLITGLNMNEVRSHMLAEANRNLEVEGRQLQRVARKSLGLQKYVDKYKSLIASQQRAMGYENEDKCESRLVPSRSNVVRFLPKAAGERKLERSN